MGKLLEDTTNMLNAKHNGDQASMDTYLKSICHTYGCVPVEDFTNALRSEMELHVQSMRFLSDKQKKQMIQAFEQEELPAVISLFKEYVQANSSEIPCTPHSMDALAWEQRDSERRRNLNYKIQQFIQEDYKDFARISEKILSLKQQMYLAKQQMSEGRLLGHSIFAKLFFMFKMSFSAAFLFTLVAVSVPGLVYLGEHLRLTPNNFLYMEYFTALLQWAPVVLGLCFVLFGPCYSILVYGWDQRQHRKGLTSYMNHERLYNKLVTGFDDTALRFKKNFNDLLVDLLQYNMVSIDDIGEILDFKIFHEKTHLDMEQFYHQEVVEVVSGIEYLLESHIELTILRVRSGKFGAKIQALIDEFPDGSEKDYLMVDKVNEIKYSLIQQMAQHPSSSMVEAITLVMRGDTLGRCYEMSKIEEELEKAQRFLLNLQAMVLAEAVRFDRTERGIANILQRIRRNGAKQIDEIIDKVEERLETHIVVENGKIQYQPYKGAKAVISLFQTARKQAG